MFLKRGNYSDHILPLLLPCSKILLKIKIKLKNTGMLGNILFLFYILTYAALCPLDYILIKHVK